MPMPEGRQFNRPLTTNELLTPEVVKPVNDFTSYKTPRDLEWSNIDPATGFSTEEAWKKGITGSSIKGNRGYLRIPGPTLRGDNG